MKSFFLFLPLIALLSLFPAPPAFAENDNVTEEANEIYVDMGVPVEPSPGTHGIFGFALYDKQRIIGDGGYTTGSFPVVLVTTLDDNFYVNMAGAGIWMIRTPNDSIRFGAGVRIHYGWNREDDFVLFGMNTRRSSLDGYLNTAWRTGPYTVGAHYYHDVIRTERGDALSLRVSREYRPSHRLRLTPSIAAEWENRSRVSYYYGVRPEEVLFFRPAYDGKATWNWNAGLTAIYALPDDLTLVGGLFGTVLGSGVTDSPIVSRNSSIKFFVSIGWSF